MQLGHFCCVHLNKLILHALTVIFELLLLTWWTSLCQLVSSKWELVVHKFVGFLNRQRFISGIVVETLELRLF